MVYEQRLANDASGCGPCMGQKKNFQTHSSVRRKFIEMRDAASTAGQLPDDQVSRSQARGHVFIAQGEERSRDTPADLLIGWGKRGLRIHLLVVWRLVGAGRSRPGCPRWERGHDDEAGGMIILILFYLFICLL